MVIARRHFRTTRYYSRGLGSLPVDADNFRRISQTGLGEVLVAVNGELEQGWLENMYA